MRRFLASLIVIAAIMPQAAVAATWLGDAQGVPSGYTGQTYPDYTTCWINNSYYQYGGAPWGPFCLRSNGGQPGSVGEGTFYSGVFSAHPYGSTAGMTVWDDSSYNYQTANTDQPHDDLGPYAIDSGGNPTCTDSQTGAYLYPLPAGDDYESTVSCGITASSCSYNPSDCYGYRFVPPQVTTAQGSAGGAPSISPSSQLTLEWSCLPTRTVNWESKGGQGIFFSGGWGGGTVFSFTVASNAAALGGPGFTTGGALTGSKTVMGPAAPGTYRYGVQCQNGTYGALAAMYINVTVTDPCPVVASQPWSAGIYLVEPGATRKIPNNYCVTNSSGNYIIVPAGSVAEIASFRNYAANVGATTF